MEPRRTRTNLPECEDGKGYGAQANQDEHYIEGHKEVRGQLESVGEVNEAGDVEHKLYDVMENKQ